ncbi:MAG: hypothetical protein ACE15C_11005 [Phycisphaerae bacterium]
MEKSLDRKLAEIHAGGATKAFILADAKDADMAFGIAAPGRSPEHADGGYRTLEEFRDIIRENTRQGLLDIMLMSVSTSEVLTIAERLFDDSPVTPAIRANDTTDIHVARGAAYPAQASRPFRTALLDHAQAGRIDPGDSQRRTGVDLGLYSITFNNDVDLDRRTLEAYKEFRVEAEKKGFRHFLEVFDPNAPAKAVPPEKLGGFINDLIVRTLAGVASRARPLFLKIVYHGPKFMEELVRYDPHLVVGVLGGSAGTTYDAFKLLDEARRHGARAALFGRKINNAEHQLSFIQFLRWIADGEIGPEEAVKAYHGVLEKLNIKPRRPLARDMQLTGNLTGYGASGATISVPSSVASARAAGASTPAARKSPPPESSGPKALKGPLGADRPVPGDYPRKADGSPDFAKMTPAQRLAYHRARVGR